jgi:hypothetical protein
MSYGLKISAYLLLTLGVCQASGCGGTTNTVEMPVNPASPPPSGPIGVEQGEPGNAPAAETSALTIPPAVEP